MSKPERAGVEFRVLDVVQVLRDGQSVALGGSRQRALLALLLRTPGQSVAAEGLVEELWAGEPPTGAATTLRSYVSRLRSALGDDAAIVATAAGYAIEVAPERVDAVRFERLIREGESALAVGRAARAGSRVREALALWRGPAYAGTGGTSGMGSALRDESERLEELRLHAIELRFEADLALGRGSVLVDELQALVRAHPYRERLWAQLMLALYRSGRQADALAAYHRARKALDEDLAVEPGEELRSLEAAILRQEVPAVTPQEERHNLPALLTSFIGRGDEIAEAGRILDAARLLTLTGVGGVGKTRLAIEIAWKLIPEFAGGAWFVDLAPATAGALIDRQIATAMGMPEQGGAALADQLASRLREADTLLILDNCEHLREATAQRAAQLLAAVPGLRILATSREALGIPGEVDYPLQPLGLPADDDPDAIRRAEAVSLFLARARAARPRMPDDAPTLVTVAGICRELEGLPLALELAAARAKALSVTEIAAQVHDRFRFLVSWRRLTTARHQTLRKAVDWSYDLLESDAQRTLAQLSVFAGGFSLDAVASVSTDGDDDYALELLTRLTDASLLVVEETDGISRYRLLETIRQYAAERLADNGEADQVREKHAAHFESLAVRAWRPLRFGDDSPKWVAQLARDHDNLRAALAWAREQGDGGRLLRMTESLWWFWWMHGDLMEGAEWLQEALARSPDHSDRLHGRALYGASGLAWARGDLEAASELVTRAMSVAEATGDVMFESAGVNTLALVALLRGDAARAEQMFEAARRRAAMDESDPAWRDQLMATQMNNMGTAAHQQGKLALARQRHEEALDAFRRLGDADGMATAQLQLGLVDADDGRWDAAHDHFVGALRVYDAAGFSHYTAECLDGLAAVANARGMAGQAAVLLGAAVGIRERVSGTPLVADADLRDREAAAARRALGEHELEQELERGRADPDSVIEAALRD
ncbi:MAG TPA: BTAD domain-containing putative transcriptional regulator [Candidatus Limnocylindria bacterium]